MNLVLSSMLSSMCPACVQHVSSMARKKDLVKNRPKPHVLSSIRLCLLNGFEFEPIFLWDLLWKLVWKQFQIARSPGPHPMFDCQSSAPCAMCRAINIGWGPGFSRFRALYRYGSLHRLGSNCAKIAWGNSENFVPSLIPTPYNRL